jgi:hypothetical protein
MRISSSVVTQVSSYLLLDWIVVSWIYVSDEMQNTRKLYTCISDYIWWNAEYKESISGYIFTYLLYITFKW